MTDGDTAPEGFPAYGRCTLPDRIDKGRPMSIKSERDETAKYRFYLYATTDRSDKYPYQIHDAGAVGARVLAKFRNPTDAELFLAMRRKWYVDTGQ